MPPFLGNLIAIAIIALTVFLAARSLWRSHKAGGCSCGCGGGCAGCSGSCAECAKSCHLENQTPDSNP